MSKLVRAGIAGFLFILIILGLNWQTGVATEIIMPMIGDFVWEDLNANGIQDVGEQGIGAVQIDLFVYGDLMRTVYSDESGYYTIVDIQPGMMYSLGFHAPSGYVFTTALAGNNATIDSDADPVSGVTGEFYLSNGPRPDIDAGMFRYASVGDRVWIDGNANGVQDRGEAGYGGMTVELFNSLGFHQSTTTTASGAYTFTRLVPDTYYLIFSLPPEYTFSPASAGIDRGLDSDVNSSGHTASFTLASGEVRTDLDAGIFIPDPCGDGTCAADEDYASCPQDCEKPAPEPVCGDRTCDSGETYTSCPLDCPRPVVCGDGVCEGSETYAACPIDCPRPIVCGDGVCEGSETYATCSADCPRPIVCGDGVCEGSENFDSCPADCPKPEVLGVTDTPVDPPPFFVSGPAAVMLSETNVKFSWVASEPVRAVVRYGRIGQDPGEAPTDESRDSDELTVTDLQPDTEYLFVVMITDAGGQSLTSEPGRFRTPRAEQAKPAAHSTPAPVEELPPADATGEQLHELQQEFHQETAAAVRGGVIIGAGLAYLAQASGAGLGFFGQALSAFLKALRNLRIPGLTELYELLENREERKKTKKELEEIAEEQEDT